MNAINSWGAFRAKYNDPVIFLFNYIHTRTNTDQSITVLILERFSKINLYGYMYTWRELPQNMYLYSTLWGTHWVAKPHIKYNVYTYPYKLILFNFYIIDVSCIGKLNNMIIVQCFTCIVNLHTGIHAHVVSVIDLHKIIHLPCENMSQMGYFGDLPYLSVNKLK